MVETTVVALRLFRGYLLYVPDENIRIAIHGGEHRAFDADATDDLCANQPCPDAASSTSFL